MQKPSQCSLTLERRDIQGPTQNQRYDVSVQERRHHSTPSSGLNDSQLLDLCRLKQRPIVAGMSFMDLGLSYDVHGVEDLETCMRDVQANGGGCANSRNKGAHRTIRLTVR